MPHQGDKQSNAASH